MKPDDRSLYWPDVISKIRARTPARLLVGRSGSAYRTSTQLDLREAHATARDAVHAELDLERQFEPAFLERWKLFEVRTQANSKDEYLLQPTLGRNFSEPSRFDLQKRCPRHSDFQIVIGDGLSATAVAAQVPALLPILYQEVGARGWSVGQPFVVRYCRVGILNEIGELLSPAVAVLLIGERPGLATAESLSAYMAFRPRQGHTDANRNLISNIHVRGVSPVVAATRIINLAAQMMTARVSGLQVREELPAFGG